MNASQSRFASLLALVLVMAAAFCELLMRELFYRIHGEILHLISLLAMAFAIVGLQFLFERCKLAGAQRAARIPFVLACLSYVLMVVPGSDADLSQHKSVFAWFAHDSLLVFATIFAIVAFYVPSSRWQAVRRAAVFSAVAFVAVQPVLVKLRAPEVVWPRAVQSASTSINRLVIYVLLDELNANRSAGIVEAFREEGMNVREKPVMPAGDGTAKVIPALFASRDFSSPKPCSVSATCSGDNVLDFARIRAGRPDIDIVGFSHPYCDIQGLRWCRREVVATDLLVPAYWQCALWRRTGWPASLSPRTCDAVFRQGWNDMLDNTIAAIPAAPAWSAGGMLYVHVALPHPPGRLLRQSLAANYEDSVQRAVVLIRSMARRALNLKGRQITFVVFSDHPLRQARWCTSLWSYSSLGCTPDPGLQDDRVPFIVASNGELPSIDDIHSNAQVFDLKIP